MGKCVSKQSKSPVNANNDEQYDYARAVDKFNEYSEEAEYYVGQGELEEAYHRYRASAFTMVKVHENCPENYKEEAESAVKKVTQRMKEINKELQSIRPTTQEDSGDNLTYLIGHDKVRQQIINLLKRNQLAMHGLRNHDTQIFLYGPSGCGKTHLAKSIAKAMGLDIMVVKSSDIYDMYIGESERRLGELFEDASQSKSCLFFDELHALFSNDSPESSEAGERTSTDFLKLMDDKPPGLVILGATNEPWKIKPTILRRFTKKYYLPLPNHENKCDLIRHFVKETKLVNLLTEEHVKSYANRMVNYSPSDIKNVIHEAEGLAQDAIINATHFTSHKNNTGKKIFLPCYPKVAGAIMVKSQNVPWKSDFSNRYQVHE